MKWLFLIFLFCMSCSVHQASEKYLSDSIRYVFDKGEVSGVYSGIYEGKIIQFNLYMYENYFQKIKIISQKKISEEMKILESDFDRKYTADSIRYNELERRLMKYNKIKYPLFLPRQISDFTGKETDTAKIIYKDLDSIPRVYYEIINLDRWNKPKHTGRLYLLYEDMDVGYQGKRIFISDTTQEYGFFILETVFDRNKSRPSISDVSNYEGLFLSDINFRKVFGNQICELSDRILPPYQIIKDEDINSRQYRKK